VTLHSSTFRLNVIHSLWDTLVGVNLSAKYLKTTQVELKSGLLYPLSCEKKRLQRNWLQKLVEVELESGRV
jgi:hypothetical protein